MARVCDRSPCEGLMEALGVYIFGTTNKEHTTLEGFIMVTAIRYTAVDGAKKLKKHTVEIEYCPFCGTRIEEVNAVVVQRFLKVRKRRRTNSVIANRYG
jgi:hypothetical protein